MMFLFQKYKRPLIVLAVVLLVILGLVLFMNSQYRVTRISPDNKNYPATISKMNVYFNRKLDTAKLNSRIKDKASDVVAANFSGGVRVTAYDDHLALTFVQTPDVGKYQLTLKNIVTTGGQTLTKTIPLVVKDIPYDKMTAEEKQLFDELSQNAGDTDTLKYPLLAKLPYETDQYKITYRYSQGDPAPTIIITMKFFEPGSVAVPATPEEEQAYLNDIRTYRTQALNWLRSQDGNLEKNYSLEYTELDLQNEFPAGRGRYQEDTGTPQTDTNGQ